MPELFRTIARFGQVAADTRFASRNALRRDGWLDFPSLVDHVSDVHSVHLQPQTGNTIVVHLAHSPDVTVDQIQDDDEASVGEPPAAGGGNFGDSLFWSTLTGNVAVDRDVRVP